MMTALLALAVLNALLTAAVLALELPHRARKRGRALKRTFVDEGISLAERHASRHEGLTSMDKLNVAVGWAQERCAEHRVRVTPSELSKLVEIRLHNGSGQP